MKLHHVLPIAAALAACKGKEAPPGSGPGSAVASRVLPPSPALVTILSIRTI